MADKLTEPKLSFEETSDLCAVVREHFKIPEPDFKAAVRDLAEAIEYGQRQLSPLCSSNQAILSAWDFSARTLMVHAAAIEAARRET